jgi:hypothetical protein
MIGAAISNLKWKNLIKSNVVFGAIWQAMFCDKMECNKYCRKLEMRVSAANIAIGGRIVRQ